MVATLVFLPQETQNDSPAPISLQPSRMGDVRASD